MLSYFLTFLLTGLNSYTQSCWEGDPIFPIWSPKFSLYNNIHCSYHKCNHVLVIHSKKNEKSFICKSLLHPMNPQNMYIYFYFILVKFHFVHPSPNLQWSFCLLMPTLIVHVSWLLSLKVRCIIMKFYSLYFLYFIVTCKLCNYFTNVYH